MTAPASADLDLTVILVNYRSLGNVEARLRSDALSGQHVIVVDNGDDPDGVKRVCGAHDATALLLGQNLGFAAAVNRAVDSAGAPATRPWLLLNPDVDLDRTQLATLALHLQPGVTGVAPLLAGADGRLQVGAAGGPLTLGSVTAYFLFLSHLLPWLHGMFLTRRQSTRAQDVDWLCMACLLLAPDAFERFGPVPEDELVYAEDVAWGTAATVRGARFRLAPEVTVRHDRGSSGAGARWIGALERLCRRRLGGWRGRAAIAAIRVGLGVRRALGRTVT
ncbi:MAG TPA: hypothetical protein VME70_16680 [Mycobacteriales bacterium]|nr:hypothetical protein [Mycobacteriales bacterium]